MICALIAVVLLPTLLQFFSPLSHAAEKAPLRAEGGTLDLRKHPVHEETIALEGAWEFVYGRFIPPGETGRSESLEGAALARVPSTWKGTSYGDGKLPGNGFATYRLRILLGENHPEHLALLVPGWETAYALYADGHLVAGAGKTGMDAGSAVPEWKPVVRQIAL